MKLNKPPNAFPKSVTDYDIRLLKIFKSVVECGGFSAAEVQLGISKSTISVHMASLETRMGLTLCRRGRGGFSLTAEGQQVYHAMHDLFSSLNNFALLVNNLGKELSGEMVILCTDQLSGGYQQKFAQVVTFIQEAAPALHLILELESLANIEQALMHDRAHIGILPPYHAIDSLDYTRLTHEPIFLCCGRLHPLFSIVDSNINADMLEQQHVIHPGVDIEHVGQQQLQKFQLGARAYNFDTRKVLILSGKYLGYLPQSQIQQELNRGEIRLIKPDVSNYQFELSMVTKSAAREPNKTELAKRCFGKVFNNMSP